MIIFSSIRLKFYIPALGSSCQLYNLQYFILFAHLNLRRRNKNRNQPNQKPTARMNCEMKFQRSISGLSLRDKVRNVKTSKINVESLTH